MFLDAIQNLKQNLVSGATNTGSLLSQFGYTGNAGEFANNAVYGFANDVLGGLDKVGSVSVVPNTHNAILKITGMDGKSYMVAVPGDRQGEGGWQIDNPAVSGSNAIKSIFGFLNGTSPPNPLAGWTTPKEVGEEAGQEGLPSTPYRYDKGYSYIPYTEGMAIPKVEFSSSLYHDPGFWEGISPYLAVASPAIIGATFPGLFGAGAGTGWTGTAAELAADGLGGVDMFGGTGLFGSAGGASMFDDLPSWMFEPATEAASGLDPLGELINAQAAKYGAPTSFDYLLQSAKDLGINPTNMLKVLGGGGSASDLTGLLSGLLSGAGGYLTGSSAVDAARTAADAQIQAAKIAADAAKFRPVGVTTNFGKSQFGFDANGNLSTAGYELTPEMKAQQQALMGTSNNMLSQFQGAQAATAPMGEAAQRAMQLGQGYLATDPQAQAAKYLAEQQALLATGRERDLASLQNTLTQQGRIGLATGGTSTGMMAANPELEAYYNALRQQDLQLAANATQGGMDYAKFGTGMVGAGGDLLSSMYGTQQNAFAPYQTALGGAQTIEGLGQNALTLGMNLGNTATAANAQAGGLLASGIANAAQTMQPANSYSPWGAMLSGAGNQLNNYTAQQQQAQLLNSLLGSGTSMFGS